MQVVCPFFPTYTKCIRMLACTGEISSDCDQSLVSDSRCNTHTIEGSRAIHTARLALFLGLKIQNVIIIKHSFIKYSFIYIYMQFGKFIISVTWTGNTDTGWWQAAYVVCWNELNCLFPVLFPVLHINFTYLFAAQVQRAGTVRQSMWAFEFTGKGLLWTYIRRPTWPSQLAWNGQTYCQVCQK